jgi:integrase
MASIKKLPNGTFRARVFVGRDASGKQLFESITRDSEKECRMAANERELEIAEGKYSNKAKVRFSTWADEWMELNEKRLAPSTYCSYLVYVDVHFKPYFKNTKLGQITETHVQRYINDKLETLSANYVRKQIWVLHRILGDALKEKNPITEIKMPQVEEYVPHVVTDEEYQKIYNKVKGTKYEIIFLLSCWCGLRRGEIFALKWNDIDWKNHMIRIDESRGVTKDKTWKDKPTKSRRGMRSIAVAEPLINLLSEHRVKQGKKSEGIKDRIFDFTTPKGCSDWFARLMDNLKMPDIRFHDLRHYHASFMYEHDIPDQYAADRLGHDVHVLKSIYQHLGIKRKLELDEKIKNITSLK